ncbi:MAG: galactose oxidase [Planctomycetota bacterium]|nr:galactose oxidase [Planctomycetota bacterium]
MVRRFLPITLLVVPLALSVAGAPLEAKIASFWMDLPAIPTARQEVGVAALDAHVYVIGGILENRGPTGIVERFDTETGEWESVAPLPEGTRLHHIGAAAAGRLVFAIGGLNSSFRGVPSVFAFNPATGNWERRADMPWNRGASGVAAIDDRIYVAGGQNGGTSFDDFAVYRVAEDRWEELPSMPTARNHLAAAVVDGIFYAVGGRAGRLFDKLEAYSPEQGEWRELAPMPTARGGIAAAAAFGWIFVFGGEGNSQDPRGIFHQVEGYDPCRNRWRSDAPMAHPRHGIGAGVVTGQIYLPGGSAVQGFGTTDTSDVFFPGTLGEPPGFFLRGDSNRDGVVDLSDAVFTLSSLFLTNEPLPCEDAADADDSGFVNITDPIFVLNHLFLGGPPPPRPGAEEPGFDPTDDALHCEGPVPVVCV